VPLEFQSCLSLLRLPRNVWLPVAIAILGLPGDTVFEFADLSVVENIILLLKHVDAFTVIEI